MFTSSVLMFDYNYHSIIFNYNLSHNLPYNLLSLPLSGEKHTIILINVCKNTTYNGCDNVVWSPTNYTTWVVEGVELPIGKTNTPPRKRVSTCSNKENCHISTPFNFRRYAFTLRLPSNTKALRILQLWRNPRSLWYRKMISISDFGSTCVNCANTHCLGVK